MKWVYPPHAPHGDWGSSWVKEADMNCNELLADFEKNWAKKIIAVEIVNGLPVYRLLFKSNDIREISREEARAKWPKALSTFLEKHIEWNNSCASQSDDNNAIDEFGSSLGHPITITC